MSESLQDEKNKSTKLKKAQLHGYQRPSFYHKSKSSKKKNSQLSNTNPIPKVLGDLKVNIQPFSAKKDQTPKYIEFFSNSEYNYNSESDFNEVNDKTELIPSDKEAVTKEDYLSMPSDQLLNHLDQQATQPDQINQSDQQINQQNQHNLKTQQNNQSIPNKQLTPHRYDQKNEQPQNKKSNQQERK